MKLSDNFKSSEYAALYQQKLQEWVRDPSAIAWFEKLRMIVELWDDLIDKDVPMVDSRIDEQFLIALVELPSNPFFKANELYLQSALISTIAAWRTSREYKAEGSDESLTRAYMLRSQHVSLLLAVIAACRGHQFAMQKSKEVHDLLLLHCNFNEYKEA